QYQGGRELGLLGMVNRCELLINVVNPNRLKMLMVYLLKKGGLNICARSKKVLYSSRRAVVYLENT
ncbi:MAG: hypothetical protein ACI85U_004287, partial [Candidatus Promineifilaceae bacterium]